MGDRRWSSFVDPTDVAAAEARYSIPDVLPTYAAPKKVDPATQYDEGAEIILAHKATKRQSDIRFMIGSWVVFLPQYAWWCTVQISVLFPQIVGILTLFGWLGLTTYMAARAIYCPPRPKRGSSRVERVVVQRIRRRSFLDEEFKRRGQFALGALDPGIVEALEAKDAATAAQLRELAEAKKGRRGRKKAPPVKKAGSAPVPPPQASAFLSLNPLTPSPKRARSKSPKRGKSPGEAAAVAIPVSPDGEEEEEANAGAVHKPSLREQWTAMGPKLFLRTKLGCAGYHSLSAVEKHKQSVDRRRKTRQMIISMLVDVIPSSVVAAVTALFFGVAISAAMGILQAHKSPSNVLFILPFFAACAVGLAGVLFVVIAFLVLAAPYSLRVHPGAHIAKMMLKGVVVGIGVLGGLGTAAGFIIGFSAALFIVAARWAHATSGFGPTFVVILLALAYCFCPLICFCYFCQGVVRMDRDEEFEGHVEEIASEFLDKEWDPDNWAVFCNLCNRQLRQAFLRWSHDFRIKHLPSSITLATALRWRDPVLTMTLLQGGADPNAIEFNRSELDHAVLGGSIDCVNILIAGGARLGLLPIDPTSPAATVVRDEAPIHLAVLKGDVTIMRALFDAGENTNLRTQFSLRTPLHVALVSGQDKVVEMLLYRPDVDLLARDDEGNTPVQVATAIMRNTDRVTANRQGPRMVLDFLRKKAELERAANAGAVQDE